MPTSLSQNKTNGQQSRKKSWFQRSNQWNNWVKPLTIVTILSGWTLGIGVVEAIAQSARIHSIQGQGKVKLQRQNRTSWDLIGVGKDIQEGDQIYPESKMKVWVRCPNQKDPVRVKAGVPSGIGSICINWIDPDVRGSSLDLATLGGYDPSLPYLIAPRHTLLVNPTPLLKWNAVPGTIEYTLEVQSPKGLVWQTKTKDNKTLYGGPALEAGTPYNVVIITNTGKSSLEEKNPDGKNKTSHLEFRLLRPAEISTLAKTKLTTIADILSLADYYADYTIPESLLPSYQLHRDYAETYTLVGEAIALLESVIQKGQSTPLIHRSLGDLYWQTGLVHPAEAEYRKAIALAKGPEYLEDVTLAQEQLGQIYWTIGKKAEASRAYAQAKEGYQALGDQSKVEELQTQLDRLKS
jgi:Tetratricopeptide repeat